VAEGKDGRQRRKDGRQRRKEGCKKEIKTAGGSGKGRKAEEWAWTERMRKINNKEQDER
jgi:hypothetical protein